MYNNQQKNSYMNSNSLNNSPLSNIYQDIYNKKNSSVDNRINSNSNPPKFTNKTSKLRIAAVQASPVFMNKEETVQKMLKLMEEAHSNGADVCIFGETFLPGYCWWTVLESSPNMLYKKQDEAYAIYLENAITMNDPEVKLLVNKSKELGIFTIFGCAELTASRGSVYCSMVFIDPEKGIVNVHRKAIPTFMERLAWTCGDGHGLNVMDYKGAMIGGLCCWENWMPLPRFTLYSQGVEVHISIWPGLSFLLRDIPRFIAEEGKVYSIAVGGVLDINDIPDDYPLKEEMRIHADGKKLLDGGTCAYSPLGEEILAPIMNVEKIGYVDIDTDRVREARRVFDAAGHYNAPWIYELSVNKRRFEPITIKNC